MRVYKGAETTLLCVWGLRYERVMGQEGVATLCCYCGTNKGLKNTLLFSYYYYIRPLHLVHPGNGNMEVLTSKNRMSATTFLSLYFSKMSSIDYYPNFNSPAATQHSEDLLITYCLTLTFIVFCAFPLFMYFKDSIFHASGTVFVAFLYIAYIFNTLFGLYTIWKELQQLQPQDQHFQQPRTRKALIQIPPPLDEFLSKVREQLTVFSSTEQAPSIQEIQQNAVTLRYLRQNNYFCTLLMYS